jgi:hypothetical protein
MKTRNRKRRGAAMLEAIIVITVLLVFLGVILWGARAYAAKLDQSANTRSDILYYASHSCEQAPPQEDSATPPGFELGDHDTPVATGGEDTTAATNLAAALPASGGPGALTRDWNMASTMREQTVEGSAIVNLEKTALTTHVKTQSWVACNEKNYGGNWNDLAQFVWDMKENGAGLLGP